ncbi:MAG: hypothetical protein HY741_03550 [Chloroflexi bacterium]|nr:hypothetical protein [Chloroflexota bacterium]
MSESITLVLPDAVMQRAKQTAFNLHLPLEQVLTATLAASLPDVEQAPLDMQQELARMTLMQTDELWRIARSQLSTEQQAQLTALNELQAERPLTAAEEKMLDALRTEYGRVTLRKARAFALLSLRSGNPLLANS